MYEICCLNPRRTKRVWTQIHAYYVSSIVTPDYDDAKTFCKNKNNSALSHFYNDDMRYQIMKLCKN